MTGAQMTEQREADEADEAIRKSFRAQHQFGCGEVPQVQFEDQPLLPLHEHSKAASACRRKAVDESCS